MFALTRLRLPIVVIGGLALAVLLALAAFTPAEAAQKTDAAEKEQTDAAAKDGTVTTENHAWGDYHWARKGNPLPLKVGDNVDDTKWLSYLETASSDWTYSNVLDTTIVAGQSSPRRCPATTGRVEVCNAKYGYNGWLGVATIWLSGSHITKATTKVNDSYFDTATYNKPEWRNLVMCQEVGHDFGLAHQNEDFEDANLGTCMDYTNTPLGPPNNEHPNTHDYEQLETMYAHLDSSNSYSAQTTDTGTRGRGGNNEPGDSPSEWGREIWREANGRASLFEKTLPNNEKKVTHVLWTLEKAEKLRGQNRPHDEHQDEQ